MADAAFRLRVSDSYPVPYRGQVLRLKVVEGQPRAAELAVGRSLMVKTPAGEVQRVRIIDHALTGGTMTQKRLDQLKELDVVVAAAEAIVGGLTIDVGWTAEGARD